MQVATLLGELIGRVEAVPISGQQMSGRTTDNATPVALAAEINQVIAPPVAVTADGIFIRAMEVVSDEVNEHGGRFAPEEFEHLCELIVDSPVLVAHDRRQLPVARNFKAAVVERDGRPWVKVWFYWPKDAAGAQDLASRIDSGVIREVSIGFEFKRPECSICGADIRECEHRPFVEYRHADGTFHPAHYLYRDVVRVLETSLVYRGATPGTRIGAGLFFIKSEEISEAETPEPVGPAAVIHSSSMIKEVAMLFDAGLAGGMPISSIADVPAEACPANRFVVSPLVDGLPLVFLKRNDNVFLFDPDNNEIGGKLPAMCRELKRLPARHLSVFGWLVRAPRRTGAPVKTGPVLLVELLGTIGNETFLHRPVIEHRRKLAALFERGKLVRPLLYRWSDRHNLNRVVQRLVSSHGCRVYPAEAGVLVGSVSFELRRPSCLWAQVVAREVAPEGSWRYRLALADGQDLHEIAEMVTSHQRYEIGRVVRVTGMASFLDARPVQLVDARILYTPARHLRPDDLRAVRFIEKLHDGFASAPTPERRRAIVSNRPPLRIAR